MCDEKEICIQCLYFTFSKDSFHVQSIGGARFEIGTSTNIHTKLLHSFILDHTDISAADFIWKEFLGDVNTVNT